RQPADGGRGSARSQRRLRSDQQGQAAAARASWICRSANRRSAEGRQEGRCRKGQEIAMAKIDVLDLNGKKVGSFELADEVFGVINEDLLWEAVQHYRAAQRAGTHATKNKKLVSGSGKRLWKQKGTGRARVGSIRSPLWRHGGTVHGPQPRSYDYQFPKKKLLGALRSALASKLSDGKLMVVEAFELDAAKTNTFRKTLGKLGVGKTT